MNKQEKESKAKVQKMATFLSDKKANDVEILEIGHLTIVCDYFLIASANSEVRLKALSDLLEEEMEKDDIYVIRKEGYKNAEWILLDYGDVIVHLFHQKQREYYNLERLWADAKHILFKDDME